jgi:hypothetical protein
MTLPTHVFVLLSPLSRSIPEWLRDIMLGYGSPSSASYRNMPIPPELREERHCDGVETSDYRHTFLDVDHVREVESPSLHLEFSHSCN